MYDKALYRENDAPGDGLEADDSFMIENTWTNDVFTSQGANAGQGNDAGKPADEARLEGLREELVASLIKRVGKHPENASCHDWFQAVAYFVRGRLAEPWLKSKAAQHRKDVKTVYYLSMEFLIGRSLKVHLINLGLDDDCRQALAGLGIDLETVCEEEEDAALGNGGLGRLAAGFLDSLTTLGYPAYGYGIRYDSGMFAQAIEDGWQVERPDPWLRHGNPWEYPRASVTQRIPFGGHLKHEEQANGEVKTTWENAKEIIANAQDLQVSGYGRTLVNTIRLWSAQPVEDFDLGHFNQGKHVEAMHEKSESEALSRVLYPDDSTEAGRALRLRQEYFFVSASLQDILGRFSESHDDFQALPEKVAIQLNDTHPALAVPELMRLLVDCHGLAWAEAWRLTTGVFAYTNHTLLPEALETWPVELFESLLPRHLDIIYRINKNFLESVAARFPDDHDMARRVSLIDENSHRYLRMAHLAIVGSHKVNGVSELHTRIMRRETFADFDRLFPGRFTCKTNGITPRRWLHQANPKLAALITERIGSGWRSDLERLEALAAQADDPELQAAFTRVKAANKQDFAAWLAREHEVVIDPASLFDVQVKRIHEYKRQLLNILSVVARYNRLRAGEGGEEPARTVIFAGKAAASYHMAKLIIKLINDVANVVNNDPATNRFLKVVFVPNYGVSVAERIIPAADLSQQISTAGTEASGTGNMKLALGGALTIGTRDGANLEIGEAVGEDNIFFFGLDAHQVASRRQGGHDPRAIYEADETLKQALDMIGEGFFSPDDPARFAPIVDALLNGGDYFMVVADFAAYVACQERVDSAYRDPASWARKAILNVAHMPRFSSDRTIRDYAEEIWNVTPVSISSGEPAAA